jgi:PPE-repeat protein
MDLRQQRANALAGLYEGGLRATTGFGQDVGQSAANVGNMLAAGGQARASGYLGQANALSNALGQAATGYGLYRGGYFGDGGMSRQLLDEILPGVTPTGRYGGSSIPYTGRYGTGR